MKKINLFQWPEMTVAGMRQLLAGCQIVQDGMGGFYIAGQRPLTYAELDSLKRAQRAAYEARRAGK